MNSLLDFELRRLKFVEACAYYVRIAAISVNKLEMTQDLADLITERFNAAGLKWAIGPLKFYNRLLEEGMKEKCKFFFYHIVIRTCQSNIRREELMPIYVFEFAVPDFDGEVLNKKTVLKYNFQSLVAWEVHDKERLLKSWLEPISNNNNKYTNGHDVKHSPLPQPSSVPSAAPHDFLIGNFIIFFFALSH